MPVIRARDLERIKDPLRKHTQELTDLFLNNWKDIEGMADSLAGAKATPKGQLMYETVVSGILLGGMIDALYEDKTLMPPPRRRGKNDRYFAWLVESSPEAAGKLRRRPCAPGRAPNFASGPALARPQPPPPVTPRPRT